MLMSEYVLFNGTAIDEESTYLLVAEGDNGRLRLEKTDVVIDGKEIYVKKGAFSELVENPKIDSLVPDSVTTSDDCLKWSCIGLIRRCCSNGKIEGICIGVVGC
jgi:hypothetical protein